MIRSIVDKWKTEISQTATAPSGGGPKLPNLEIAVMDDNEAASLDGLYQVVAVSQSGHSIVWMAIDVDGRVAGATQSGSACAGYLRLDNGKVSGTLHIQGHFGTKSVFGGLIPHTIEFPPTPLQHLRDGIPFKIKEATLSMMLHQVFPKLNGK